MPMHPERSSFYVYSLKQPFCCFSFSSRQQRKATLGQAAPKLSFNFIGVCLLVSCFKPTESGLSWGRYPGFIRKPWKLQFSAPELDYTLVEASFSTQLVWYTGIYPWIFHVVKHTSRSCWRFHHLDKVDFCHLDKQRAFFVLGNLWSSVVPTFWSKSAKKENLVIKKI